MLFWGAVAQPTGAPSTVGGEEGGINKECKRGQDFTILATSMMPAASASLRTSKIARVIGILADGINILHNLAHRGAVSADPLAGDGAGILIQLPDRLFRAEAKRLKLKLPKLGHYGVGMVFLPRNVETRQYLRIRDCRLRRRRGADLAGLARRAGRPVCARREHPAQRSGDPTILRRARRQLRRCRCFRAQALRHPQADRTWRSARASCEDGAAFYIASLSTRTVIYKGMVIPERLALFYKDLADERAELALALVHARFSTNTFPTWELAHPFRYLAHNGEINTLRGNINWMMARRHSMTSQLLGADLDKLWPLIGDGNSDSATLDNCLELLVAGGYPLPHALMMLIPEAWADNPLMDPDRRAFYEYHAALMEPWDGPAAIAFTDGRQIGATLDRNGLRPARFFVTDDDHVVMASEAGVLDVPEERIVRKWRLEPGKMLLVDLERERIIDDDELKSEIATAKPYQHWLDETQIKLETLARRGAADGAAARRAARSAAGLRLHPGGHQLLPEADGAVRRGHGRLDGARHAARRAVEPAEAALRLFPAALRPGHQPADRFDPRGAGDVARVAGRAAAEPARPRDRRQAHPARIAQADPHQRRSREDSAHRGQYRRHFPHLDALDVLSRARWRGGHGGRSRSHLPRRRGGGEGAATTSSCSRIGSSTAEQIAVPSLLAVASVHHHLIRGGLRTEVGLVVETGEARQLHDFCLLAGYGAEAINPYLAFDTLSALHRDFDRDLTEQEAHEAYIKAIAKGLLKVMSKMGICTFQSYCGAQIFDAIGLNAAFLDQYFTGTVSADRRRRPR